VPVVCGGKNLKHVRFKPGVKEYPDVRVPVTRVSVYYEYVGAI